VFIYSSPGFKSGIKERMLYASCKEPLITIVEDKLGLPIAKKVKMVILLLAFMVCSSPTVLE